MNPFLLIFFISLFISLYYFFNNFNKEIFIPKYPTYNELYIQLLQKDNLDQIKYLGILPKSDSFVSKNNLWNILRDSEFSNIVPKTFLFDNYNDIINFKNSHSYKKKYILKKNLQNKMGIKVISGTYNYILNNKKDYLLIQEFIRNEGEQFVLRIYILGILRNDNLEIYYNNHYKILFSKKGELITDSKYIHNKQINIDLGKLKNIFDGLKYIFETQIENTLPKLIKFQLFGIDIKYNKKMNPYLLEINKNPNMKNYHNLEEKNKKKILIDDIYNLVLKNNEKNSFIKL